MKRSTLVEYSDASPEVRAVYDEIMATMGAPDVLNTLKALGHNPRVLRGVWSMLKATLIEGEIPELLKQLILFRISIVAGNEYCTSFPVAIDIVARASLEPKSVEDPDWEFEEELRDEGFSESEIDELLAVGYFSVMMNMLTDTYDVPWESPFPPPGQA